jgi:transposase-like protein
VAALDPRSNEWLRSAETTCLSVKILAHYGFQGLEAYVLKQKQSSMRKEEGKICFLFNKQLKLMVILTIKALVSDASCYEKIRELRWPTGVCCPRCDSTSVIKRGKDDKQKERQRYECKTCSSRFDDLTGTILEGHHQPLKTWVLCLFMGLNLSNQQIAAELDLNKDDVRSMTSQLREGWVKKNAGEVIW